MKLPWPPSAHAMQESRRLWPDPFLAPDVPPRATLERYLAMPQEFGADFTAQIEGSIESQRALDRLRRPLAAPVPVADAAGMALLRAITQRAGNVARPPTSGYRPVLDEVDPVPVACLPGEIWTSKADVEFWDGTRIVKRQIFSPPAFLVTTHPQRRGGDTVVHAVAVTNADIWPKTWRMPDDLVMHVPGAGDYVAHLDTPATVSLAQMHARLGAVREGDCQRVLQTKEGSLRSSGGALPFLRNPEASRDREQLRECARWLGATAEARELAVPVPGWVRSLWEQTQGIRSGLGEWWRERLAVMPLTAPVYALGTHAAHRARSLEVRRFRVGQTLARILVMECAGDTDTLALAVVTDPDRVLEGGSVVDMDGRTLTTILNGRAASTFAPDGGSFFLRLADDSLAIIENEAPA